MHLKTRWYTITPRVSTEDQSTDGRAAKRFKLFSIFLSIFLHVSLHSHIIFPIPSPHRQNTEKSRQGQQLGPASTPAHHQIQPGCLNKPRRAGGFSVLGSAASQRIFRELAMRGPTNHRMMCDLVTPRQKHRQSTGMRRRHSFGVGHHR